MEFQIFCPTAEKLVREAELFAQKLAPGSVVALVGGLGMGKTHWTKGVLSGLGSPEVVTSPTFSLLQEYSGGSLPVFHFDLYRLQHEAEVLNLGWDDYLEAGGVVVAEWADLFPDLFPPETIWLEIREKDGGREVRTRMQP
ncbi:tRNA (adenosine(37)-N6)-threonylcarbamoyltransferase complex ATPase subunit type 1 TsaE [Roseibacillus ishigakijimensis]|uniref:tRNA threonylcarbamoyladenosine biosynthesis protein TsaE n=2 Tax=Roseibacillus ishigakijimensis TaxID=454146 RepID=A0A934RJE4_9BACT|nr:tRNA (adenosine(37)-N6)-threonylcarbamoyltransferase complex ATPase subunit type 1 TsaE [Roseibacillus ishigakijimensis]